MKTALIALGSNLADPKQHVQQAIVHFGQCQHIHLVKCSPLYQTAPISHIEQDDFINAVIRIKTTLDPEQLLKHCLDIENSMGRIRREKDGPRIIDCDLLWMENEQYNNPSLTLPHPRMHLRHFVLAPLLDVYPDFVFANGISATEYCKKVQNQVLAPL